MNRSPSQGKGPGDEVGAAVHYSKFGSNRNRSECAVWYRAIHIIIIHWTHYLFSDWPKAYSEFSKSAPVTSSSCRLYNNHDGYNKSPCRKGSCVLSFSNLGLPPLHGDLLYSSPGARAQRHIWTVQGMILTVSGHNFSIRRLTYKFYGAWWLRVASWWCFSGFLV